MQEVKQSMEIEKMLTKEASKLNFILLDIQVQVYNVHFFYAFLCLFLFVFVLFYFYFLNNQKNMFMNTYLFFQPYFLNILSSAEQESVLCSYSTSNQETGKIMGYPQGIWEMPCILDLTKGLGKYACIPVLITSLCSLLQSICSSVSQACTQTSNNCATKERKWFFPGKKISDVFCQW